MLIYEQYYTSLCVDSVVEILTISDWHRGWACEEAVGLCKKKEECNFL